MNLNCENGIIAHNEFLLNSIWQRDPNTGKSCEGVLIIDTILYKYFHKDSLDLFFGIILHTKVKLLLKKVKKSFLKKFSKNLLDLRIIIHALFQL